MTNYWFSVPNCVRLSKGLTPAEKETYYALQERLTAGGYVVASNEELMKDLNINETALLGRLGSLEAKDFIFRARSKQHKRIFYLRPPRNSEERKPTDEELTEKKKLLQNAYKKGLFFDEVEPEALAERLLEVRYLEDMIDHTTQFVLNLEEIKYIAKFLELGKEIDCQIALYRNIDIALLLEKINESEFLKTNKNLSLKWCMDNSVDILADKHKTFKAEPADIKAPTYTDDQLASLR